MGMLKHSHPPFVDATWIIFVAHFPAGTHLAGILHITVQMAKSPQCIINFPAYTTIAAVFDMMIIKIEASNIDIRNEKFLVAFLNGLL